MHDLVRRGGAACALLVLASLLSACGPGVVSPTPQVRTSSPGGPAMTSPPAGSGTNDGGPPLADGARVVVPKPGQLDVHPVSIGTLGAVVQGRTVTISADWWSGVEPCTILDSILVTRDGSTFAITLREGRGPEDVACIAIAELHRAFIDLGELEPGIYTVRDATGGAPAIRVVVR